ADDQGEANRSEQKDGGRDDKRTNTRLWIHRRRGTEHHSTVFACKLSVPGLVVLIQGERPFLGSQLDVLMKSSEFGLLAREARKTRTDRSHLGPNHPHIILLHA